MKTTPLRWFGEVTVGNRGVVTLPDGALHVTGWEAGDKLFVQQIGDDTIILTRRPENMAEAFAGRFSHLYPDPEDTKRFIAEERASWSRETDEA